MARSVAAMPKPAGRHGPGRSSSRGRMDEPGSARCWAARPTTSRPTRSCSLRQRSPRRPLPTSCATPASTSSSSATPSRLGEPASRSTKRASSDDDCDANHGIDGRTIAAEETAMTTEEAAPAGPARRGRSARHAERLAKALESVPYLTRKLPPVEVLSVEGLEAIEHNADTLLQEVGIEIVNYPEAAEIFRRAGADVQGMRVRFPRGMCRELIQATAPRSFTQVARNRSRSV